MSRNPANDSRYEVERLAIRNTAGQEPHHRPLHAADGVAVERGLADFARTDRLDENR